MSRANLKKVLPVYQYWRLKVIATKSIGGEPRNPNNLKIRLENRLEIDLKIANLSKFVLHIQGYLDKNNESILKQSIDRLLWHQKNSRIDKSKILLIDA